AIAAYDKFYAANGGLPTSGGTPVRVAVLDTGADTAHPDLQGNLWQNAYGPGIDITTISGGTANFNPVDISPIGHGTHVAGIIGAVSNNATGIIGTMPYDVQPMILKVFQTSGSDVIMTTTSLQNGIEVAYLNGASIINLSIEASGDTYDAVASSGL